MVNHDYNSSYEDCGRPILSKNARPYEKNKLERAGELKKRGGGKEEEGGKEEGREKPLKVSTPPHSPQKKIKATEIYLNILTC
jgi:hypothetical protein